MFWLWSGPTESNFWFSFSISIISRCRVLIFVLFLYSFDFYILGDVAQMSKKPFTRTEQMPCVYHGRTKGEGCGHVKSIKAPSKGFTDRSKAMLLLWFTISVIISLCMYVLLIFFVYF